MSDAAITRDDVAAAVAACQAANRRAGLRPVWRAIVERTGKHPSFSTVSRFLAELAAGPPAAVVDAAPPDLVVAQVQQLAPAMWQAALVAARQELASELQTQAEHLTAASERERDLLAELDASQESLAAAEHERQAADQRANAQQERLDAQAAAMQALADAQRQAGERWSARERELSARLAQLERESATLAAAANQAREAGAAAATARDRIADELREAQRRTDADLALNAHLREQLAVREQDLADLQARLTAADDRARAAELRQAVAERTRAVRDPVLRDVHAGIRRLERQLQQATR